jgi:hypothetical protein
MSHPNPAAPDPEGYTPLSQQPYSGLTPPPPRPRNGLGIASLVLGTSQNFARRTKLTPTQATSFVAAAVHAYWARFTDQLSAS